MLLIGGLLMLVGIKLLQFTLRTAHYRRSPATTSTALMQSTKEKLPITILKSYF
mgnify:CR=1 FL=1